MFSGSEGKFSQSAPCDSMCNCVEQFSMLENLKSAWRVCVSVRVWREEGGRWTGEPAAPSFCRRPWHPGRPRSLLTKGLEGNRPSTKCYPNTKENWGFDLMWGRRLKYVSDGNKLSNLIVCIGQLSKITNPQPFVNFQKINQLSDYFRGWGENLICKTKRSSLQCYWHRLALHLGASIYFFLYVYAVM